MKIRVKVSRSQMQEMLKDEEGSNAAGRKVLIRSRSKSDNTLGNDSDHTVATDGTGSVRHYDHLDTEHSTSTSAADCPTTSSSLSALSLPSVRQVKRSNSLRRLLSRQDPHSLVSSDDEDLMFGNRSGSKERSFSRSGSFKILLTRKHSSEKLNQDCDASLKSRRTSQTSSSSPPTKSRRSWSRGRQPAAARSIETATDASNTPIESKRKSLRSKSSNPATSKTSLSTKRQMELELSRQASASRIRELDNLLASKSHRRTIETASGELKLLTAAPRHCATVHSWDGALVHATPSRAQRQRVRQQPKIMVDEGRNNKPVSTNDVLLAFDDIMNDFDGNASFLDTNTGW